MNTLPPRYYFNGKTYQNYAQLHAAYVKRNGRGPGPRYKTVDLQGRVTWAYK